MSANDNDRLAYGIPEAAHAMSVSKSTIWNWIALEKVKTKKVGGRTLIPRSELERLLQDDAA
jgi:excisionase family DNA binding protein